MEHDQNQNVEEDRIRRLPDCLLVEILSRLPLTKYAIRTDRLSKRWQHLWTYVPNLVFIQDEYKPSDAYYFCFVHRTINQCSRLLKLNKFRFKSSYGYKPYVNDFISYAINRNVQELSFDVDMQREGYFVLDQVIFNTSSITDLKLSIRNCVLNPIGDISWNNLKSLSISFVKLNEDLIQNILSGSPLLETLELEDCYGYKRLDITTNSVRNFVLNGVSSRGPSGGIKINAPNIMSLTIKGELWLSKLLLLDVSCVVEAYLDYLRCWYETTSAKEEEMLNGFILKLPHVKTLKIGEACSKVLSHLEDKGFSIPSNLKVTDVS